MKRTKPGLTMYSFNMITVMAAIISAATTVFIATRHGEMAARINEMQLAKSAVEKGKNEVRLADVLNPDENDKGGVQVFVGAFQPKDKQNAVLQFWIPAADFKASSDGFTTEEKIVCENNYAASVQKIETEIIQYAGGWNVSDINGCWTPNSCEKAMCAICEPGKIYTVVLDTPKKMKELASKLAAPARQGLIHKLFCQDATFLVMNITGE